MLWWSAGRATGSEMKWWPWSSRDRGDRWSRASCGPTWPAPSPGSRRRGRSWSATASNATPPASRTTPGPAGRRWPRCRSASTLGFRNLEVTVPELEGLPGPVLGSGLHEIELSLLELEVGAKGVHQIVGDLLALVGL